MDLSPIHAMKGLAGVMAWQSANCLPLGGVEIVQQDEFSLDYVVPLPDGRAVVFGIT